MWQKETFQAGAIRLDLALLLALLPGQIAYQHLPFLIPLKIGIFQARETSPGILF
jgi:hypothetical protein